MSASVTTGIIPAGKPHPTMKWTVMVALFVVVTLGVPRGAVAGQPTVGPPSGPQSGGVFTGTYTFSTYISCDGGPSFNSSYSNALEGTHTFTFVAGADGSLLVRIDGGGAQLLTSCGNPTPVSTVANYTVTYSSTGPPTPTPTPAPTPVPPTPTPVPPSGGGSSGGGGAPTAGTTNGSGGGTSTPSSRGSGAAAPGQATASPSSSGMPGAAPAASAAPTTAPGSHGSTIAKRTDVIVGPASQQYRWRWFWTMTWLAVLLTALAGWFAWRSLRLRAWLAGLSLSARLRLEPQWFRLRLALGRMLRAHGRELPKAQRLSAHHHTGRLLAHHHTSYSALAFLLTLSTVVLGAYSLTSRADSTLSLTVLGPPPSQAATIDQPTDGQTFTTATTTVRGTCPAGLLVEIYRNGTFAGSDVCDAGGLYNVIITLVNGTNQLVARDLDALGQYGPDSGTVIVEADLPLPPAPTPTPTPAPTPAPGAPGSPTISSPAPAAPRPSSSPTAQRPSASTTPTPAAEPPAFLLTTIQHSLSGIQAGSSISWPVELAGGVAPYHLDWDWGDGATDSWDTSDRAISRLHTYKQPGSYRLTIYARDSRGQVSALTLAAIVNGPVSAPLSGNTNSAQGSLLLAWPLLGLSSLLVLSFWLGEHHKLALFRFAKPPHSS